jgi:hypothetical protein
MARLSSLVSRDVSALEHIEPANRLSEFPPRPDFPPLNGTAARQALFGRFEYVRDPQPGNPEAIRIQGDWVAQNIVAVELLQLKGVPTYAGASGGTVRFHRKAASQLQALWKAWETTGLLDRVIFWGGSFVPRLIRGTASSADDVSAHAFGAAFDINVPENRFGVEPARLGERGCVRELVNLANAHGFYWGGHFRGRPDGMHFEIARLTAESEADGVPT